LAKAANLRFVMKNFVWKLEGLTPASAIEKRALFRHIDAHRKDPETQANRRFTVAWIGSEEDHQVGDVWVSDGSNERPASHTIQLEVYYQAMKQNWLDLHDLIASDRHDITLTLRDDASLTGYNADNTSTDIGLWDRSRESDELDRGDDIIWTLRQEWRCIINEIEA